MEYGSQTHALDAALAKRMEFSDENGLTKNKYRYVTNLTSGDRWVEFQLTRGRIVQIDESDFDYVCELQMSAAERHGNWYCTVSQGATTKAFLHKLLTGFKRTDHIDRNGLNNRRGNLRETNPSLNGRNRRFAINNTSGRTGVRKTRNFYVANGACTGI